MGWLTWFGRWGERDAAYAKLAKLKGNYGEHGDRVIRLSARTDLARTSVGSTLRAFDFVERSFVVATQEYARIGELLDGLEAGLGHGRLGDFAPAEAALKGLGPKLDELDRNLSRWEEMWKQVPLQIEEANRSLVDLAAQVDATATELGAPLPLGDRVTALQQHLERTRRTLAEGNPVEASHLVEDLQLAMNKVIGDVGRYSSGTGAIRQAEQEIAEARGQLGGTGTSAAEALAAAEALLPRLRPALAAGKLEQFQADLLRLQRHLRTARTSLPH